MSLEIGMRIGLRGESVSAHLNRASLTIGGRMESFADLCH